MRSSDQHPDESERIQAAMGAVIKAKRQARGLSQRALATLTDLERSTISYIEQGSRAASVPTLFELAAALGVSPSDLLKEVEARLAAM